MFYKMRRHAQQLPQDEAEALLRSARTGILALCGQDGYPYAVPVNHVFFDGKIAFHCAKEGHKLDAIRENPKVSFCAVLQDEVMPVERTTAYVSVIAFGQARVVENEETMRRICAEIGKKYCPDHQEGCYQETEEELAAGRLCCVEIEVEHLTGKCSRRLMAQRNKENI